MDDAEIISLYFQRSETAISQTATKYGKYCYQIAYHILSSREDSEESVNDTYLAAWNAMPPRRPNALPAFLGKLTRYISLDRWKNRSAQKRGGGQVALSLDELEECVAGGSDPEKEAELQKEPKEKGNVPAMLLAAFLNLFLPAVIALLIFAGLIWLVFR